MAVFPVLVVCEGNLCRSPFAERMLRLRLEQRGAASRFDVTSAGTRAPDGVRVDPRSEAGLLARGTDGIGFRSRRLTAPLVDDAGLVLAATRALRASVLEESPGALNRTFTILELAHLAPQAPSGLEPAQLVAWCASQRSVLRDVRRREEDVDVPDPVRADQAVFDRVAVLLDEAATTIAGVLAATPKAAHLQG